MFCRLSTAATTLRFNGSQYFRLSVSNVSRDLTTYNMSLRIRTRQSQCHLMTLTSSVSDAQLRLFVDRGRVNLGVPTLAQPQWLLSSSPARISSVVSLIFLKFWRRIQCSASSCLSCSSGNPSTIIFRLQYIKHPLLPLIESNVVTSLYVLVYYNRIVSSW